MSDLPSFSELCGLFLRLSWPRMRTTATPSSGKWWKISNRQKMPRPPPIPKPMRYTLHLLVHAQWVFIHVIYGHYIFIHSSIILSTNPVTRLLCLPCTETLHGVWCSHAHYHVKEHHLQSGVPKRSCAAFMLLHQTGQGWCLQPKAS